MQGVVWNLQIGVGTSREDTYDDSHTGKTFGDTGGSSREYLQSSGGSVAPRRFSNIVLYRREGTKAKRAASRREMFEFHMNASGGSFWSRKDLPWIEYEFSWPHLDKQRCKNVYRQNGRCLRMTQRLLVRPVGTTRYFRSRALGLSRRGKALLLHIHKPSRIRKTSWAQNNVENLRFHYELYNWRTMSWKNHEK